MLLLTGDLDRTADLNPYFNGVSSLANKLLKTTLFAELFLSCSSKNSFNGDFVFDLLYPDVIGTVSSYFDFLVSTIFDCTILTPLKSFASNALTCSWYMSLGIFLL